MIGAFGTVTKGLEDLEVGGRVETIQTTALFRTARILRVSWRLEETCYHLNSIKKPPAKTDVQNSHLITTRRPDLVIMYKKGVFTE